ncbi:MAG: Rpn family recombination-promoting nuclease/putative transposase [Lachnospiraceae bacterium]|nr:Rpn family recombination-promoting nuclease/putative transposase [Lachnospiraceae bacterium]
MAKKQQDLRPDTILKNYWNNNEQFADFFNAVLFEGRQVIRSDELEDVDTEESTVLEHREYAESIKASRDTIKIQKQSSAYGVQFVMLGMEGQEHVHYAMPMRVMGYDYGIYKKLYDSNAKKYKSADGLEEDEYLSRMKRTDRFVPVITVVVYYGEKAWDGAVSLHEMLDIPEEMKQYVNDYKMLLIEARQNNLNLHNMENRDLFNLLQIFLDKSIPTNEAKEKAIQYCEEHKTSKSVIMTVAGATNSKIDYNAFEKGDGKMCTLVQEIERQGEAKGEAKGEVKGEAKGIIETGYEFGLSDNDILERLQNKLNISLQKAQEYIEMFGKQTV